MAGMDGTTKRPFLRIGQQIWNPRRFAARIRVGRRILVETILSSLLIVEVIK